MEAAAGARVCDLCGRDANVHCASDSAFLCFNCDSKVHTANFLAARHLRRLICSRCNSFARDSFSGARSSCQRYAFCRSCSPGSLSGCGDDCDSDSTSCSSCISSTNTTSLGRRKRISGGKLGSPARFEAKKMKNLRSRRATAPPPERTEGIYGNWCANLGLNRNLVIPKAREAMKLLCSGRLSRVFPFQVSLAASFLFGLRFSGNATSQNLRALENVSGVPAKLIVAVEVKLKHLAGLRTTAAEEAERRELEEGWAECSV